MDGDINMNGNINMDGDITIGGDLKLNGFFKRIKTEITSSNYNSYTTTTNGLKYIDIKKCGTYIHIKSLPSNITQINLPYHKLPYANKLQMPSLTIDRTGIDLMRQIYGTEIIIVNDTTKNLLIGCRGAMNGGTTPSGTIPLNKGCMEIFKLEFQITSVDSNGNAATTNGLNIESYCWLPTSSGTISAGSMSNNTNAGSIITPSYPA
jgi:hypothetical protein